MELCPGFMQRTNHAARRAFTLVELLVVIGIIALLISILIPSLSKARKAALTIKCASSLREIGHAYQMYANDNRGYWPPVRLNPSTVYSIGSVNYLTGTTQATTITYVGNTQVISVSYPCYWYNFISKYLTSYVVGAPDSAAGATGGTQATGAHQSVLWGCPAWGNGTNGYGYTNYPEQQIGYGINSYPTMTASYPASTSSASSFPDSFSGHVHECTLINPWSTGDGGFGDPISGGDYHGQFYQQKDYTHPSERALGGDSILWLYWSYYIKSTDPATMGNTVNNTVTPSGEGITFADLYRHGDYPKLATTFSITSGSSTNYGPGGKVSYNILFCDDHVITSNAKTDAFKYMRMKYPG